MKRITGTEKGWALYKAITEGPADPATNPLRFPACTRCGRTLDLCGGEKERIWWSRDGTFRHKAPCPSEEG